MCSQAAAAFSGGKENSNPAAAELAASGAGGGAISRQILLVGRSDPHRLRVPGPCAQDLPKVRLRRLHARNPISMPLLNTSTTTRHAHSDGGKTPAMTLTVIMIARQQM